jgi:hypothetical protein
MICTSACPSDGAAARKAQHIARRRPAANACREAGTGSDVAGRAGVGAQDVDDDEENDEGVEKNMRIGGRNDGKWDARPLPRAQPVVEHNLLPIQTPDPQRPAARSAFNGFLIEKMGRRTGKTRQEYHHNYTKM